MVLTRSSNVVVFRQLTLIHFMLFSGLMVASSASEEAFLQHGSSGRSLLQTKTSCSENFEFKNYTIITSQCKGPNYSAKICCSALKEFACPYATLINDESTDCADQMFSYINIHGKYPPGLFANLCKEGKLGLECSVEVPDSSPSGDSNASNAYLCVPHFLAVIWLVIISFGGVLKFTGKEEKSFIQACSQDAILCFANKTMIVRNT